MHTDIVVSCTVFCQMDTLSIPVTTYTFINTQCIAIYRESVYYCSSLKLFWVVTRRCCRMVELKDKELFWIHSINWVGNEWLEGKRMIPLCLELLALSMRDYFVFLCCRQIKSLLYKKYSGYIFLLPFLCMCERGIFTILYVIREGSVLL